MKDDILLGFVKPSDADGQPLPPSHDFTATSNPSCAFLSSFPVAKPGGAIESAPRGMFCLHSCDRL